MNSFLATAYYGSGSIVSAPVEGEDIEAAMVNAEIAFTNASVIVVEPVR